MLRELADDGSIDRRRKRLHHAGTLPPVVLADITGRDCDGEFLARPTEWDEQAHGAPPVIHIVTPRRAKPGEAGGVGDRALIRIERSGDNEFTGRVIKLIDRAKHRTLGIFRALPSGGGRLVPIEKKGLGRELNIAAIATKGAADGDLVAVDVTKQGKFGQPAGTVVERLGSIKSERAVSLIAIYAHDIPHVFPQPVLDEAQSARAATMEGREDWRDVAFVTIDPPDAKDHDDAVHAVPDPDPKNAGGHIVTVAIADVACYVRPGTPLDREAVKRGNSVYFPDRVVPMLPERISNDLCSLRPKQDRPALAVRMVIGSDGRKALAHIPSRDDPLDRETALRAGAACGLGPPRRRHRNHCRARAGAALCRLSHGAEGARGAQPARPRSARAQDRAEIRRHRRSRGHAAAARVHIS